MKNKKESGGYKIRWHLLDKAAVTRGQGRRKAAVI
nr:MAG TPA: hypothetical protein [Caudoviricetes sp.]